MNEIIKIDNDNKVSGRELHEFLEVGTDYRHWIDRMLEYGFTQGADFNMVKNDRVQAEGNRKVKRLVDDASMTIEMAKEICMLQRTDRGKQARQYFIQVENDWNSPDKIMARALVMSQKLLDTTRLELAQSKQIVNELQPKASYYDLILQSKSVMSVSKIAKDFGKSAVWLNRKLEEKNIQYNQGGIWLLYQKYAEKGYTQSVSHVIDDEHSRLLTKWTQKGRLFIYELLKGDGILPLIEQTETI